MNPITEQIMNEIEQDKIIKFCEDTVLFNAVKKYLLVYLGQGIGEPGKPLLGNRNYALQLAWNRASGMPRSNEELGADIRALTRGIEIIESAFKELGEIKRKPEPVTEEGNPAV